MGTVVEASRGDNAEGGVAIEAPQTGRLTPDEHAKMVAARPPQPAPQSIEENLHQLAMKGLKPDGKHRPSHPEPLSRVAPPGGTGKYIPTVSLQEGNIKAIEGYAGNEGSVQCALECFSAAHIGLQKLSDAREAAKANGAWTEAQQVLNVAKAAEAFQERTLRSFDNTRKRLMDNIASIETSLNQPLVSNSDNSISGELRTLFRGMKADERHAAIDAAVKAKDVTLLTAVLGCHPMLSGLTPERQQHFTRQYRSLTAPDQVIKIDVMRRALELVERSGPLVLLEVPKAIGASWEVVEKLRKTNSAAEQALHLLNNPVQS